MRYHSHPLYPTCGARLATARQPAPVRLAAVALALALAAGPGEARMYRWVDDQGNVHYSDQVPPTQAEKGHTELNELGVEVGEVPPAKTLEEIRRERELERLRAQQRRLVEQQNAADRVLLRTYRSVDDLLMAREGKLAAIDVLIEVAKGNIRRHQDWLRGLRGEAANAERAGKPVPQHVIEGIEKTERHIGDAYAAIVQREQEKDGIRKDFDRDLKRFRQLNDIPEDSEADLPVASRPVLGNLVTCTGNEQCSLYWSRAVAYVQRHATTAVETSGPNIVITARPETREDLSLTLSRVEEKAGGGITSLFLDSQCRNQGSEDSTCKGEYAKQVLEGFRAAIASGDDPLRPPQPASGVAGETPADAIPAAAPATAAPGPG